MLNLEQNYQFCTTIILYNNLNVCSCKKSFKKSHKWNMKYDRNSPKWVEIWRTEKLCSIQGKSNNFNLQSQSTMTKFAHAKNIKNGTTGHKIWGNQSQYTAQYGSKLSTLYINLDHFYWVP